ncbi:MAG: hypothetical protein QNJ20_06120, partial [Paracoccaceae bacterium]|nr:hypothetical protein [Paracoccaceae bacterium]
MKQMLQRIFRILSLAMLGLAIFFFFQTATVFIDAIEINRKFRTPDNPGYFIAFYLLVFTIGFLFLALWFHRIAQVLGSTNMPPPG